jgi:hypothetical protein
MNVHFDNELETLASSSSWASIHVKDFRKAFVDPAVASYRGRIVTTTGDGMLVEFASAGIVRPSILAVRRFTVKRKVVGCSTGISAGLPPLAAQLTLP